MAAPERETMTVRNRKQGVRRVRAGDLIPHGSNWRKHPPTQRAAMEAILEEVGDIDYLKVVETPEGLMLVDGHLRADIQADSEVDVVVLDLDPQEQAKVLATFDPLAAMAQTNMDQFLALAETIESESGAIKGLLEAVANNERLPLPTEWPDLPTDDRSPIGQMTFTISDTQKAVIERALASVKRSESFDTDNENSNGNALAFICEAFNG